MRPLGRLHNLFKRVSLYDGKGTTIKREYEAFREVLRTGEKKAQKNPLKN